MTAAYVDSSCLIAVLFGEPTAAGVGQMLGGYARLFASNLLDAEVSAAARRERITLVRPTVFHDLLWVLPARPLGAEIDTVPGAGYLRGADLWHVACALYVRAEVQRLQFLTLDASQRVVAAALGFRRRSCLRDSLGRRRADQPIASGLPRLAFHDDLSTDDQQRHLPLVHCRECGMTRWGGVLVPVPGGGSRQRQPRKAGPTAGSTAGSAAGPRPATGARARRRS